MAGNLNVETQNIRTFPPYPPPNPHQKLTQHSNRSIKTSHFFPPHPQIPLKFAVLVHLLSQEGRRNGPGELKIEPSEDPQKGRSRNRRSQARQRWQRLHSLVRATIFFLRDLLYTVLFGLYSFCVEKRSILLVVN